MKLGRQFKMSELLNHCKRKFFECNIHDKSSDTYEAAIEALNGLQSNADYLKKKKNLVLTQAEEYQTAIVETQKYLTRSGLSLEKLDSLSVIHITGTKGKGSTSAYCESILRYHGYKTGLFISPHLHEVRERIQINGKPLDRDVFKNHFWKIYKTLINNRDELYDMPAYFKFLTVMAFNVFVKENVDVAVIEVGIGGEYDSTNILRKVPVAGITSLGYDHTFLLGNTIEEIAWQKGGIMKKDSKVFTVPQDINALQVLKNRSIERNCSLEVIDIDHNLLNIVQVPELRLNASLAIALVKTWIMTSGKKVIVDALIKEGIDKFCWPGRYQIIEMDNITYYLDGAHTIESMQSCVRWFKQKTENTLHKKVLIFNLLGNRNSEELLIELHKCNFESAIFVPNIAMRKKHEDAININITENEQFQRCYVHKSVWLNLLNNNQNHKNTERNVMIFPTIYEALQTFPVKYKYDVLVTGSLHLVGATLGILTPKFKE